MKILGQLQRNQSKINNFKVYLKDFSEIKGLRPAIPSHGSTPFPNDVF